jgi:hypothetical protein
MYSDSDDEMMMAQLLQNKFDAPTDDIENLIIISCAPCFQQLNDVSRHGGSNVGKRKNKDLERMAGAMMLKTDYFVDQPTHTESIFDSFLG